jgi:hypothetical protein
MTRVRVRPQLPQHREAVNQRHDQIEDDDIRWVAVERPQGFQSVGRLSNVEASRGQRRVEQTPDGVVVFNE